MLGPLRGHATEASLHEYSKAENLDAQSDQEEAKRTNESLVVKLADVRDSRLGTNETACLPSAHWLIRHGLTSTFTGTHR